MSEDSNPFDTRLPLGSKHKIEARQEGYEASSQTIRIESRRAFMITLKRGNAAAAPTSKCNRCPKAPAAGFVTAKPY